MLQMNRNQNEAGIYHPSQQGRHTVKGNQIRKKRA